MVAIFVEEWKPFNKKNCYRKPAILERKRMETPYNFTFLFGSQNNYHHFGFEGTSVNESPDGYQMSRSITASPMIRIPQLSSKTVEMGGCQKRNVYSQ